MSRENFSLHLIVVNEKFEIRENSVILASLLVKLIPDNTTVVKTEVQKWTSGSCVEAIKHRGVLRNSECCH